MIELVAIVQTHLARAAESPRTMTLNGLHMI